MSNPAKTVSGISLKSTNSLAMAALLPGKGLGRLYLGDTLYKVFDTLRASRHKMELIFPAEDPFTEDGPPIIIVIEATGIRLYFESMTQRLRLIEVSPSSQSIIVYKGHDLFASGKTGVSGPSFKTIYNKVLGPSYPGHYYEEDCAYVLSYPGVCFRFPLSEDPGADRSQQHFVKVLSSNNASSCSHMAIFKGTEWNACKESLFCCNHIDDQMRTSPELNCYVPDSNMVQINFVDIVDQKLLSINFLNSEDPFDIKLHVTTMLDIWMRLGRPDEVYSKSNSRVFIHRLHKPDNSFNFEDQSGADNREEDDDECGVFFNYRSLGIDVLFAGDTNRASKVFLHGNVPGTRSFQNYHRCRWRICDLAITSEDSWNYITSVIPSEELTKPILLAPGLDSPGSSVELVGAEDDDITEDRDNSSWGTTELVGYERFIFEISRNRYVSILTIL